MTRSVQRNADLKEYFFEERCFITELWNSGEDDALSIARARVEPGVTTVLHSVLTSVERYVILDGEGDVEIDGGSWEPIMRDDVVVIPAGVSQRVRNTGSKDLVFLALCTPRFRGENYQSLE